MDWQGLPLPEKLEGLAGGVVEILKRPLNRVGGTKVKGQRQR